MKISANKKFKSTFWTTLATLLAVSVMISLGVWQLQRLEWKQQLLHQIQVNMDLPLIQFEEVKSPQSEYRRIQLEGEFLHDKEFLLPGSSKEGKYGYFVVTPFQTTEGIYILINRGWIPENKKERALRLDGQIVGKTMIQGIIRWPQKPGILAQWAGYQNQPSLNQWLWIDIPQMFNVLHIPIEQTFPWIVEAESTDSYSWPRGGQTRVNMLNNHLQYAVTWFGLATVLTVIYILFNMKFKDGA